MKSKVYFVNLRAKNPGENKINKLKMLFDKMDIASNIEKDDLTAIKLHFGESGGDGFINPIFVRPIVDKIKEAEGKPFLTDTNTLYSGSRFNAVDHMNTAIEHGFVPSVVGAPVIISDGLKSEYIKEVEINKKHYDKAKIAGDIVDADAMVVMSHFKGHEMAGFGGAIKNLAMGCAPAAGKQEQHALRPLVAEKKCVGCGKCIEVCPQEAINMKNDISYIDKGKCVGCGECMTVCGPKAIRFDWSTDLMEFCEKMAEYAYASVKNKEKKVAYINFLMNITPHCDCVPWSDAPIVPDIGILASVDPIAIDKASLDLVNKQIALSNTLLKENANKNEKCNCGKGHFNELWENTHGEVQISYGEEIGMGSSEYELIEI